MAVSRPFGGKRRTEHGCFVRFGEYPHAGAGQDHADHQRAGRRSAVSHHRHRGVLVHRQAEGLLPDDGGVLRDDPQSIFENTVLRAASLGEGPGVYHRRAGTGRGDGVLLSQRTHAERGGAVRRHRPVYGQRGAAGGVHRAGGAHRLQPDVFGRTHAAGRGCVLRDRHGAGAGAVPADGGGQAPPGGADLGDRGDGGVQRRVFGVSVPAGRPRRNGGGHRQLCERDGERLEVRGGVAGAAGGEHRGSEGHPL